MIPPVWIVAIALDLLRRDGDPLAVLPSLREQRCADVLDLRRVAILLVATALGGLIRHIPRAVKPFVELHILRWMVVLLSLSRER
jgi:hypothetical protein